MILRFLLVLLVATAHAALASAPNFIVIFCDDLGYGDLGCFGHPTIRTPHLDELATTGQRWTNFYVGASVCTPSRAALLTGRLPIRSGLMSAQRRVLFPDSAGGLPASEITIAELLRDEGYATACVGKWHLGHLPPYLPTANGFNSYWGIPYSNDMDSQPGFPNYRKQAELDANYVAPIEQFDVPILDGVREIERPANQHTLTKRYTEHAVQFIRDHHDQPFFLYLAHNLPHIPLYAGEEHLGTSARGVFGDVIEEIDAGVGQIVAVLRELDIDENTLVVFTSDNGPWLPFATHGGSAGLLRGGKGTTFEGGMREPTIFWWPQHVRPGVQTELGATMDLLPTFAALAGAAPPDKRILDGYNLAPVLLGQSDTSSRDRVFYWRESQLYAVRQGPWKAHFVTQGCYSLGPPRRQHDQPLLYHLGHDPSEKYNVAAEHPDVVERLAKLADDHRRSIDPVEDQVNKRTATPATPTQRNDHAK